MASWPTLRPLAPRTDPSFIDEVPSPVRPLIGKLPRKNVATAACSSCRQRKVKCNAQRPSCAACRKRNVRCEYDADPLETPGQALKRKYTQLQDQASASATEKIYKILQMRSEDEALDIFRRIRRGADPESVLRLIENADVMIDLAISTDTRLRFDFPYVASMPRFLLAVSNEYLQSPIYDFSSGDKTSKERSTVPKPPRLEETESIPFLRPYHAASIVDPRLRKIKPSDWTVVSEDDNLMRAMLHHFFMYEYQWHVSFQKDYFLDDMVSGGRQFCSPLLVNSILAHASHSTLGISNRSEFWNPRTLGYQFMAEAKRLWDMERGNNKLTTVQAGPILYLALAICGADKIGSSYLIQSVAIAENLGLFRSTGGRVEGKAQDARDFTAWAIFCTQIFNQWYFQDQPLMDKPPSVPLPDPIDDMDWYGEIWLRYPSSGKLHPAHFGSVFRSQILLNIILNDIACKHFSREEERPGFSIQDLLHYHEKTVQWYDNLPMPLTPSRVVFPSQLKLHMHYQNTVVRFMTAAVQLQKQPIRSGLDQWTAASTPQQLLSDATVSLETLIRLYCIRHSFERMDTFLAQPLAELAAIRGAEMTGESDLLDKESVRSTLVLCAQGFRDQGFSHYLGQTLFHLTRSKMRPEDAALVDRCLYSGPQRQAPFAPVLAHQIFSDWPVDSVGAKEHQRLSAVLSQLEGVTLDSTNSAP